MKTDQSRVSALIKDTVVLLCKEGLTFSSELTIQAVVAVTVDKNDFFVIQMNEVIDTMKGSGLVDLTTENIRERPETSTDLPASHLGSETILPPPPGDKEHRFVQKVASLATSMLPDNRSRLVDLTEDATVPTMAATVSVTNMANNRVGQPVMHIAGPKGSNPKGSNPKGFSQTVDLTDTLVEILDANDVDKRRQQTVRSMSSPNLVPRTPSKVSDYSPRGHQIIASPHNPSDTVRNQPGMPCTPTASRNSGIMVRTQPCTPSTPLSLHNASLRNQARATCTPTGSRNASHCVLPGSRNTGPIIRNQPGSPSTPQGSHNAGATVRNQPVTPCTPKASYSAGATVRNTPGTPCTTSGSRMPMQRMTLLKNLKEAKPCTVTIEDEEDDVVIVGGQSTNSRIVDHRSSMQRSTNNSPSHSVTELSRVVGNVSGSPVPSMPASPVFLFTTVSNENDCSFLHHRRTQLQRAFHSPHPIIQNETVILDSDVVDETNRGSIVGRIMQRFESEMDGRGLKRPYDACSDQEMLPPSQIFSAGRYVDDSTLPTDVNSDVMSSVLPSPAKRDRQDGETDIQISDVVSTAAPERHCNISNSSSSFINSSCSSDTWLYAKEYQSNLNCTNYPANSQTSEMPWPCTAQYQLNVGDAAHPANSQTADAAGTQPNENEHVVALHLTNAARNHDSCTTSPADDTYVHASDGISPLGDSSHSFGHSRSSSHTASGKIGPELSRRSVPSADDPVSYILQASNISGVSKLSCRGSHHPKQLDFSKTSTPSSRDSHSSNDVITSLSNDQLLDDPLLLVNIKQESVSDE